jgi:hypothetical protein
MHDECVVVADHPEPNTFLNQGSKKGMRKKLPSGPTRPPQEAPERAASGFGRRLRVRHKRGSATDAPQGFEQLPRAMFLDLFLDAFGGVAWANRPGQTVLHSLATSPWTHRSSTNRLGRPVLPSVSPLIGINYLALVHS